MKLLRWTLAGATAYVVYKYSIGKKAKGEDVFVSPDQALEDAENSGAVPERASPAKPKRQKARAAKPRSK